MAIKRWQEEDSARAEEVCTLIAMAANPHVPDCTDGVGPYTQTVQNGQLPDLHTALQLDQM